MKKFFVFFTLIILGLIACEESSNGGVTPIVNKVGFDRTNLLVSWADDFIIPQFEEFLEASKSITTAKETFLATPTEENLVALRTIFTDAYAVFQPVAAYNIGKASELNYYLNLNAHPLNVDKTLINVAGFDTVDLSSTLNQDAQGLPAVDYLLNGLGTTDAEVVSFYTGDEATAYKGYLSLVVDRIEDLTQLVVDDLNNGYRETFVNNTSASSAGSIDVFVNTYIEYFEKRLRASKVGTPAGVFTTISYPDQIESLYNPTQSKQLLVVALEKAEALYLGEESTESLSSVLISLGKADLDTEIKEFFNAAQADVETKLGDDLKSQIETDNTKMLEVRDALQKIVVYLKVDMVSAMGIDIVFQDNDGD